MLTGLPSVAAFLSNSRAEQLRLTTRPLKPETLTPWTLYKALADTKQNQPLSSGLRVYFRSLNTGEEGTGQEGEGLEWQNLMPHVPLKRPGHSLVVQRLGLYAFTADGPGSIPSQVIKILQATCCAKKT